MGFTKVPNELLEALAKAKLNGTANSIMHCVIRYTCGFHREEHDLSYGYISVFTGKNENQIGKEVRSLMERRILIEYTEPTSKQARVLGINFKFEQWCAKKAKGAKLHIQVGVKKHTKQCAKKCTKKESTKKTIKEKQFPVFEVIWEQYPITKDKWKVTTADKKCIEELGVEKMESCLKRYITDVEKRRRSGFSDLQYKHGGNFFHSAYTEFLEAAKSDMPVEDSKIERVVMTSEMQVEDIARRLSEEKNCLWGIE